MYQGFAGQQQAPPEPIGLLFLLQVVATHDHTAILRQDDLPRFMIEDNVGEFVCNIAGLPGARMPRIVDNHIPPVEYTTDGRPPPRITNKQLIQGSFRQAWHIVWSPQPDIEGTQLAASV